MSSAMLWLASGLMIVAGVAHSYLGERGFMQRLLALPGLPLLKKDRGFTERVIRVIWHAPSLYWATTGVLLMVLAVNPANPLRMVGLILAATMLAMTIACIYCGWRHPAIVIFAAAAALTAYAVW
jgi:hypothetical protein